MSLEHAKAFVRKLQTDPEFREQMKTANETDRPALVKDAGFTFSGEELAKVTRDVSDKDLAAVIGGFGREGVACGTGRGGRPLLCTPIRVG
jgi:predicted ribosomally synthesized peptide with nif11-like leader